MTIETITTDDIIRGIEDSLYELDTESRLARVGLKDEQDLAAILEKYAWLFNLETVRRMGAAHEQATEPGEQERLRRAYYYLLDGYVDRQVAPIEDRIVSFEMDATVEVDGETIPFHNVRSVMAREPDFERRNRLDRARLAVVAQTNPDRLEAMRERLQTLARDFGYGDYISYNAEKKRVDYQKLRSELEQFLANTEGAYRRHMGRWVEETTGRRLGELGSHHVAYITRLPRYDEHFGKDRILEVYRQTMSGLGLAPEEQANIHLDTEDRPRKNPRAVCYAPKPPGEVHLIIKPIGGFDDYVSLFHEAGHAQHYGNVDPSLSFIDRVVGTSYALTEIYSFLLQFLTMNLAWVRDVVGVPEDTAREVIYYAKLSELFLLRRYVGKLRYELGFYVDPLDSTHNQDLYARELNLATDFVYSRIPYLSDIDPGLYVADYLRAWITEAMLRRHLETEYGEDWFGNAQAGEFLRKLWASGETKENEEVARMLGERPFDTSALTAQFLQLDGAS